MGLREFTYSHQRGSYYIIADIPNGGDEIDHELAPMVFSKEGVQVAAHLPREDPAYTHVVWDFYSDLVRGSESVVEVTHESCRPGIEDRLSL